MKLLVVVHKYLSCAWSVFGGICRQTRTTHMINICEPLQVISIKVQFITPWWWILCDQRHIWVIFKLCLLNFYTIQILTSTFCIIECISRLIKVTHTETVKYLLPLHCNNGCTNAPQPYVYTHTGCLAVFFSNLCLP